MSKSMCLAKPNFAATIHFTVGIEKSAAITKVEERWLSSLDDCDVFENDLIDEGATAVLECVGIDLGKEGSFVVEVLGEAKYEESPDYEIVELKPVTA
ncbi:TPA: hypothetical protein RUY84_003221 [Vibrio cholerae]|nr:hypothetical protein [Vibrio cholerae]